MKYVLRFLVLCVMAALLIFAGCQETPADNTRKIATYPHIVDGEPLIRVLALESAQPVELVVSGSYDLKVTGADGKAQSGGGKMAVTVPVAPVKGGIKLGQNEYKQAEVTPHAGNLRIRYTQTNAAGKTERVEKAFPGTFIFNRSGAGKLRVVVRLPLEQYLVGVLPGEMELASPPEALKAQAVASRTYALYQLRTSQSNPYDVYADVRSQMWRPTEQSDPRARMAVNSTVGIVLLENYRLFPTYFHSDCGGTTANARYVFSSSDVTALSGISCPHGAQSYPWTFTISKEALSTQLAKGGIGNGRILRIDLLNEKQVPLQTTGRIYFVKLSFDNGVTRTVTGNAFRLAVGAGKTELASTWFYAIHNPNGTITFKGQGFGHGVGFCQNGAKYMAGEGSDFVDILRLYYPGAVLLRLW